MQKIRDFPISAEIQMSIAAAHVKHSSYESSLHRYIYMDTLELR